MGTPAIGQLDSDPELEIVVPGYSSSGKKIYAVNHDGSVVSGDADFSSADDAPKDPSMTKYTAAIEKFAKLDN